VLKKEIEELCSSLEFKQGFLDDKVSTNNKLMKRIEELSNENQEIQSKLAEHQKKSLKYLKKYEEAR
jgi:hypothetical protein